MNKIELIPAIDLIGGECVRLQKGDYSQKTVYDSDPVRVAERLEREGFRRLHIVDLDGARERRVVNHSVLRAITSATSLTVDFGGGITSSADIDAALHAGASMVTVGSVAMKQPALFEEWLSTYGASHLILGADVREGKIAVSGWEEQSSVDLFSFLDYWTARGVCNVLCTDISRDGMLSGPATDLYRSIMQQHPTLHLIASGGVKDTADILSLAEAGIPAVVFGKAYYEGRISTETLMSHGTD